MSTITILDYGAGNLTSVRLACERFGYAPDEKFINGDVFVDRIELVD